MTTPPHPERVVARSAASVIVSSPFFPNGVSHESYAVSPVACESRIEPRPTSGMRPSPAPTTNYTPPGGGAAPSVAVTAAAQGAGSPACTALSTVLANVGTIGNKAYSGTVEQADVDRAFGGTALAGVPADAMPYVEAVKVVAEKFPGRGGEHLVHGLGPRLQRPRRDRDQGLLLTDWARHGQMPSCTGPVPVNSGHHE